MSGEQEWKRAVTRLKKRVDCYTPPKICIERARIITESYRSTENEEPVIRRAKALRDILTQMSISVLDDELIVGNQASSSRAAPLFPEYAVDWIKRETDQFAKRSGDRFQIDEEDKKELMEVFKYWEGKTHSARIMASLPENVKKAQEIGVIYGGHLTRTGDGHLIVDYEKALKNGLNAIITEAEEKLEELDLTNPSDLEKRAFLTAVLITSKAAILFANRYSSLAKNLAQKENRTARRHQLELISKICSRVPANPAQTFSEAIQSLWFIHLVLQIESNGHSVSLGRFDQYMYPFYKKDVGKGKLTRERALELVEHLWIKFNCINKIRNWSDTRFIAGYPVFQNLTIGGQSVKGEDATNELSYICLEATADLRMPQPSLSARYHLGCPHKFLRRCCEVIKLGIGMPALYNDEVVIPALLNRGIGREDAVNYGVVGCVEVAVPGKWGYRSNGMSYFNMLKVLELTLNEGADPRTGTKLCPGNGHFDDFEEVMKAWKRQTNYYVRLQITHDGIVDLLMEKYLPNPFCSALVNDCIQRGKTIKEGGAVYDLVSGQLIGLANTANSLAAVKKLVFEKKRITLDELKQALNNNFTGNGDREVQLLLRREAPKYGNDEDYVDILARDVFDYYAGLLSGYKNTRYGRGPKGGLWHPSTSTVTANIPFGSYVGATPDGRGAGFPMAEGISPAQGTDCLGPTAVSKSVSKLPNILASGGQLLNMKFSPSMFKTEEQTIKFMNLIKIIFLLKVWHVQFNVVSADTLQDAQKKPHRYPNLMVRVAGYSARFVDLDPSVQTDIIRRTEQKTY